MLTAEQRRPFTATAEPQPTSGGGSTDEPGAKHGAKRASLASVTSLPADSSLIERPATVVWSPAAMPPPAGTPAPALQHSSVITAPPQQEAGAAEAGAVEAAPTVMKVEVRKLALRPEAVASDEVGAEVWVDVDAVGREVRTIKLDKTAPSLDFGFSTEFTIAPGSEEQAALCEALGSADEQDADVYFDLMSRREAGPRGPAAEDVQLAQGFINLRQMLADGRDITSWISLKSRQGTPMGMLVVSIAALDVLHAAQAHALETKGLTGGVEHDEHGAEGEDLTTEDLTTEDPTTEDLSLAQGGEGGRRGRRLSKSFRHASTSPFVTPTGTESEPTRADASTSPPPLAEVWTRPDTAEGTPDSTKGTPPLDSPLVSAEGSGRARYPCSVTPPSTPVATAASPPEKEEGGGQQEFRHDDRPVLAGTARAEHALHAGVSGHAESVLSGVAYPVICLAVGTL